MLKVCNYDTDASFLVEFDRKPGETVFETIRFCRFVVIEKQILSYKTAHVNIHNTYRDANRRENDDNLKTINWFFIDVE